MEKFNYIQPDYLFCELPIKDNTFNDNRIWIYCRLSLSLVEFVNVDDFKDIEFKGKQQLFQYENNMGFVENYFAIYVQNNCEAMQTNEDENLKNAWKFLQNYFIWEDNNL